MRGKPMTNLNSAVGVQGALPSSELKIKVFLFKAQNPFPKKNLEERYDYILTKS
jgi:hypothetical protein